MIFNQNIFLRIFAGRAGFFTALLAGVFISCVKIEDNNQGGTGYLAFQSISVDVSVKEDIATKANVPQADLPSESDFIITISGSAIEKDMELRDNEHLSGPILLPAGTYDVSVSYGSNVFGEPYFYYSKKVDIKEDQTESMTMDQVPLANAMVKVELPDLEKHLKNAAITLSHGNDVMNVQKDAYQYVPVKDGLPVIVSLVGTNAVGEQKTFSYSLDVQAKHAYNVVFDLTLPNDFSFKDQSSGAIAGRLYLTTLASGEGLNQSHIRYELSSDGGTTWTQVTPAAKNGYWLISDLDDKTSYQIRAVYGGLTTSPWTFTPATPVPVTDFNIAHTYSDSRLIGSKVDIEGNDVSYSAALDDLITSHGVKLVNSEGVAVLTLTDTETGTAITSADWPYIPQGDYTARSYYVIGGEEVIYQTMTKQNASPAPQFTVTVYAETSYSRYTSSDASLKAKANDAGTGDKVMNISGEVSISESILSKYSDLVSTTFTYDGISMLTNNKVTTSVFYPNTLAGHEALLSEYDITGQASGSHTVAAVFSFDGVTKSKSIECQVTGIPYSKDFTSDKNLSGWSVSGNQEWSSDGFGFRMFYMYFGTKNVAQLSSPEFYLPQETKVKISAKFIAYSEAGNTKSETAHIGVNNTVYTLNLKEASTFLVNPTRQVLSAEPSISNRHRITVYVTPGSWSRPAQRHHIFLPEFSVLYY